MKKDNKNDASANILSALKLNSDKDLSTTSEHEIYSFVKDYLDNRNVKMYPFYRMYGEGGANHIVKEYPAETWIKNQFLNAKTAKMIEKDTELKALEYQTFCDIVTGAQPIYSIHLFKRGKIRAANK